MKSYSKFQNYLSLLMFITINILFYFKYLSKISIACGAITSVLYILFIIFLFKYKPTFGRKLVNVGIITFIIATSSLLFLFPKKYSRPTDGLLSIFFGTPFQTVCTLMPKKLLSATIRGQCPSIFFSAIHFIAYEK